MFRCATIIFHCIPEFHRFLNRHSHESSSLHFRPFNNRLSFGGSCVHLCSINVCGLLWRPFYDFCSIPRSSRQLSFPKPYLWNDWQVVSVSWVGVNIAFFSLSANLDKCNSNFDKYNAKTLGRFSDHRQWKASMKHIPWIRPNVRVSIFSVSIFIFSIGVILWMCLRSWDWNSGSCFLEILYYRVEMLPLNTVRIRLLLYINHILPHIFIRWWCRYDVSIW